MSRAIDLDTIAGLRDRVGFNPTSCALTEHGRDGQVVDSA